MKHLESLASFDLKEDGACLYRGAVVRDLAGLRAALAPLSTGPGVRLSALGQLIPPIKHSGSIGSIAASVLGSAARPVRAILFDKTPETNWSLGWHQDRTICVRQRLAVDGFGPWTIKSGLLHVAPPFDLLSRMVTLRIHLDDVCRDNAPLLIAPGSHTEGRIAVERIPDVVRRGGVAACTAEAGDICVYSTPILHASEAASAPTHRRVLQLDFAAEDLPAGLEWLDV